MSLQPLTQIKANIDKRKSNQYQQIKSKNNIKYYQLYLEKIIFIQRFWRKTLFIKAVQIEVNAVQQLSTFERNLKLNFQLKSKLQKLKIKKKQIQDVDILEQSADYKKTLENQLKNFIANLLNQADRYAKIKAVLCSQILSYQNILKQNETLKIACQQNTANTEFMKKKNRTLEEKIKSLRYKITEQKAQIFILKQKALSNNFKSQSYHLN